MTQEQLVEKAAAGDRDALTELIGSIRDRMFGLALRMLSSPQDAEDATQEILLQIVTRLGTFRGEASFLTWAYRVATNHLLNVRRKSADEERRNFRDFARDIDQAVELVPQFSAVQVDEVLRHEIRLSCTHSMLVCLTREERIAFILGGIFEVSGDEGAALLDIEPATFRKRLSRARGRLEEFMRSRCGVFDRRNHCSCEKIGKVSIGSGMLTREQFRYARLPVLGGGLAQDEAREFTDLLDAAAVLETQPNYATPTAVITQLEKILANTKAPGARN